MGRAAGLQTVAVVFYLPLYLDLDSLTGSACVCGICIEKGLIFGLPRRFVDGISNMCLRDMHREETGVICEFAIAWVAASHRRTSRVAARYGR